MLWATQLRNGEAGMQIQIFVIPQPLKPLFIYTLEFFIQVIPEVLKYLAFNLLRMLGSIKKLGIIVRKLPLEERNHREKILFCLKIAVF